MNSISLVPTLFFLFLCHYIVDFMIGIWPVYKTLGELDLAKAGLIAGLCAFIGESTQIFFGFLGDKGFRQKLILFGVFVASSSVFFAYTFDYYLLFLLYLTTCIGSAAFHVSSVSLLGNLTSNKKALLITIFAVGGALGLGTSQLIFSNVFYLLEGHTIFLAIPTLCIIAFIAYYGLQEKGNVGANAHSKEGLFSAFKLLRHRKISLLYFTQICNQTVSWGTIFLLPDVLVARGYDDWVCYGGGHLAYILGGALTSVPAGYIADRYSPRNVIFVASVLGMGFFYYFITTPFLSATMVILVLSLMGATIQVVNPVLIAFGNSMMPDKPGAVSALLMGLAWCVSELLGPGGGGFLATQFTEDAPAKALSIIGSLFFVGSALTLLLPKKAEQMVVMETVRS